MQRDFLGKFVIAYIDDFLIYPWSYDTHITNIRQVLPCLLKDQFYGNSEKCEFHVSITSFLGYIISPEGVAKDDTKVAAVMNWLTPKTIKDLQHFLGFASFCSKFIQGFSSIANPLTTLLKKSHSAQDSLHHSSHPEAPWPFHALHGQSQCIRIRSGSCIISALLRKSPSSTYLAFFFKKPTVHQQNRMILLGVMSCLQSRWCWKSGAMQTILVSQHADWYSLIYLLLHNVHSGQGSLYPTYW